MRKPILALLLALAPISALNAMDVATFLAKADALQRQGMLAMFSSDIGLLKGEIQQDGKALRAEQAAAQRAGRRPAFCMPAKAQVQSDELIAHLRTVPAAERSRTQVRDAFRTLIVRKYPCPG
jgi:hypothetical protein